MRKPDDNARKSQALRLIKADKKRKMSKSELRKELWQQDEVGAAHGIIDPKGKFHAMHPDDLHVDKLYRLTGGNQSPYYKARNYAWHSKLENALKDGWVFVGRSGRQAVKAHHDIISNLNHPAVHTLRRLARDNFFKDSTEVQVHFDLPKEPEIHDVHTEHFIKHGTIHSLKKTEDNSDIVLDKMFKMKEELKKDISYQDYEKRKKMRPFHGIISPEGEFHPLKDSDRHLLKLWEFANKHVTEEPHKSAYRPKLDAFFDIHRKGYIETGTSGEPSVCGHSSILHNPSHKATRSLASKVKDLHPSVEHIEVNLKDGNDAYNVPRQMAEKGIFKRPSKLSQFHKTEESKIPKQKKVDIEQPLTVRGHEVFANSQIKNNIESDFDDNKGILHTPKGSFKVYLPHKDEQKLDLFGTSPKQHFENIIRRPDIQKIHTGAMNNFFKLNHLMKQGKIPDEVVAHAALFTTLSANNAVPMHELTYSRLVDTMKRHGIDPRHVSFQELMGKKGKIREAWRQSDIPTELPEHSREYWQGPAKSGIIQQNPSKVTGRKAGDIYKLQYVDAMGDKLQHYPKLHQYLTDLVNTHKENGQSAVSQMMEDKVSGKSPMNLPAGFGPKIARYFYSMLGSGNIHVPDTHLVRHLFGLDSKKDTLTHKHLKQVLWDPKNHALLNKIDNFYANNYPTMKFVQDKYFGGKPSKDAIFPAFWLHWLSIAPHEKMIGIGKPHAAKQTFADHTPYWDKAREILERHGLSDIKKADSVNVPLPIKTASAMYDLYREIGPHATKLIYYSKIVPILLSHHKTNNQSTSIIDRMKEKINNFNKNYNFNRPLTKRKLDPRLGYKIFTDHKDKHSIGVMARDKDGKNVGRADMLYFSPQNEMVVSSVDVFPEHRRRGIATAMYEHAEKETGRKIHPSMYQSREGKSLWLQPNRKFGKSQNQDLKKYIYLGGRTKAHGWISPQGKYYKLEPHEHHNSWIAPGNEENPDHDKGWIEIGKAGRQVIVGKSKVLSNPNHPATRESRRLVGEHFSPDSDLSVNILDGKMHFVSAGHWHKHGTTYSSKVAEFHKAFFGEHGYEEAHGWIDPQGRFYKVPKNVYHGDWIRDNFNLNRDSARQNSWLAIGHGGLASISGRHDVLGNPNHPATKTARNLTSKHYFNEPSIQLILHFPNDGQHVQEVVPHLWYKHGARKSATTGHLFKGIGRGRMISPSRPVGKWTTFQRVGGDKIERNIAQSGYKESIEHQLQTKGHADLELYRGIARPGGYKGKKVRVLPTAMSSNVRYFTIHRPQAEAIAHLKSGKVSGEVRKYGMRVKNPLIIHGNEDEAALWAKVGEHIASKHGYKHKLPKMGLPAQYGTELVAHKDDIHPLHFPKKFGAKVVGGTTWHTSTAYKPEYRYTSSKQFLGEYLKDKGYDAAVFLSKFKNGELQKPTDGMSQVIVPHHNEEERMDKSYNFSTDDMFTAPIHNPSGKELQRLSHKGEFRAFLVGKDMIAWSALNNIHQPIRKKLKLPKEAIPIHGIVDNNKVTSVYVTDNSRNTPVHNNPKTHENIKKHPHLSRLAHPDMDVDYYNEDVVGKWHKLNKKELDSNLGYSFKYNKKSAKSAIYGKPYTRHIITAHSKSGDKVAQFRKGEELAKEGYGQSSEEWKAVKGAHGWISPEGKFHQMPNKDDEHGLWLSMRHKLSMEGAYNRGWLAIGHGGHSSVSGHHDVLTNPEHKATKTARRLIDAHFGHIESVQLITHTDAEQLQTGNQKVTQVPTEHWIKHGTIPKSKVAEFHKGSMRRLAPIRNIDTTSDEQGAIRAWIDSGHTSHREITPEMHPSYKKRALHKLHSLTQVRKNPKSGEREFLLHRGIGPSEKVEEKENNYHIPHETSWTPHKEVADDFARQYYEDAGKKGIKRTLKAWIPESKIKHIPNAIGEGKGWMGSGEHEVMVHANLKAERYNILKSESILNQLYLLKGSMQRLAPFNPQKESDRPSEHEEDIIEAWQEEREDSEGQISPRRHRESIEPMKGNLRARALHRLHGATKVRRAKDGKREFLLHRGTSAGEKSKAVKDDKVNHSIRSSWTPDLRNTYKFSDRSTPPISAWVHEDNIVHVPKHLGKLPNPDYPSTYHAYKEEGYIPKGANKYAEEYEVIVEAGHNSDLHTRKTTPLLRDLKAKLKYKFKKSNDDLEKTRGYITFPQLDIHTPHYSMGYKQPNKLFTAGVRMGVPVKASKEIARDPDTHGVVFGTEMKNPRKPVPYKYRTLAGGAKVGAHHSAVQHEMQHGIFHNIEEKYGRKARDYTARHLIESLPLSTQTTLHRFVRPFIGVTGRSLVNEEKIAHVHTYLSNPEWRKGIHEYHGIDDDKTKRKLDYIMKQIYSHFKNKAKNITPEYFKKSESLAKAHKIVAIDFDKTIVNVKGLEITGLKPYAKEGIEALKNKGYKIIIWSGRNNPSYPDSPWRMKQMREFLDKERIPYDVIDEGKNGKPKADYFIDDKAIEFKDNWKEIPSLIKYIFNQKDYDNPHGWVDPKGNFHKLHPLDSHESKFKNTSNEALQNKMKEGWIAVGHAGHHNIQGHSEILNNPKHPATRKAREIAGNRFGDTMHIHYSDKYGYRAWEAGHKPYSVDEVNTKLFARHGKTKQSKMDLFRSIDKENIVKSSEKTMWNKIISQVGMLKSLVKSEGKINLIHYSPNKLSEIKPEHHGKGVKGADRGYIGEKDYEPRSYYYTEGTKPEHLVAAHGKYKHHALVDAKHVYDAAKDPHGYAKQVKEKNQGVFRMPAFERKVKQAGFKGYKVQDVVAMFEPLKPHKIEEHKDNFKKSDKIIDKLQILKDSVQKAGLFKKVEHSQKVNKDSFLPNKYSIITADNPAHKPSDKGGNKALESKLKAKGYKYEPVAGKYSDKGIVEHGFLVHDADRKHMNQLGAEHGQESVIHSEGGKHRMYYTGGKNVGKYHAGEGHKVHEKEPDNYYSTVTRDNKKRHFTLNFNFDKLHKFDVPKTGTEIDIRSGAIFKK